MSEIIVGSVVICGIVMVLTLGLLVARRNLLPQGAVEVRVNGDLGIMAARGESLLSVLAGAGIAIPAGCGGKGTCGLCRVTVTGNGAGEALATERGILSGAERKAHVRLACQVGLRGPVGVEVPADVLAADSFECRVRSNRMLAPLIRELVLEVPERREIGFRAGGFMQLKAPAYKLDFSDVEVEPAFFREWEVNGWTGLTAGSEAPVTRAYSIANRPEDAGTLVFNIRLAVPPAGRESEVPAGIVSSYLFSRQVGDSVGVSGPFGDFHVQPTDSDMVFIGGGVGMAPLRAMIHEQVALRSGRRIWYFYGARTVSDLFYADEFEAIAAVNSRFIWTPALSDPAPGDRWRGATGFIHETVERVMRAHPAPEDCEFYLCGPPVMISAVIGTLTRLGVERRSIFNDDFGF